MTHFPLNTMLCLNNFTTDCTEHPVCSPENRNANTVRTYRTETSGCLLNFVQEFSYLGVLIFQGANPQPQRVDLALVLANLVSQGFDLLAVVLGLVLVCNNAAEMENIRK